MINFSCLLCGNECERADEAAGWEYIVWCTKCGFMIAFEVVSIMGEPCYFYKRQDDKKWQNIPDGCLLVFDLKEGG